MGVAQQCSVNSHPPEQEPSDLLHSKLLWLFVVGTFVLFLLTFWFPMQDILTHLLMRLGGDTFLQHTTVPYELRFMSTILTLFGFHIQAGNAYLTWQQALGKQEYIYFTWNCGGWQSFLLFFVSALPGLAGKFTRESGYSSHILRRKNATSGTSGEREQEMSLFNVCTIRMRRNQVASFAAKLSTKLLPDCHH